MTEKVVVSIIGLLITSFLSWFFFGKHKEESTASDRQTIVVEGGYKPSTIKILTGKSAVLTFIRKDPNSCLEEIVFPDYKIKEYLPLNKPVAITLNPPHKKQSAFHCGMNMFRGKLVSS